MRRPAAPREEGGEREGAGHRATHVYAHQPRGVGILRHRKQNAAEICPAEHRVDGEGDGEPDNGDHDLQWVDSGTEEIDRVTRQRGGQAARFLAKGEQNDVVEHHAPGHRGKEPGIRVPLDEGAHQDALDHDAEKRAAGQGRGHRQRHRPAQCNAEHVAQHRPEGDGASLREIHRTGDGVGHVEAEGDEPIHAPRDRGRSQGSRSTWNSHFHHIMWSIPPSHLIAETPQRSGGLEGGVQFAQ